MELQKGDNSEQGYLSHYRRSGRLWSTDPALTVDLAVGVSGIDAAEPTTVSQSFKAVKKRSPDHPALRYKEDGVWKSITFTEYYALCVKAAKSFLKLGLEPLHAVAIIGSNCPNWIISDLGAILAGGIVAGIFAGKTPEGYHYVAYHCRANIIVVENEVQLEAVLKIRDRLPLLKAIVQYKGKLSQNHTSVYEWEQFLQLGEDLEESVLEEAIKAQKPEQCALIVHTSGTTGEPKGVMISHDNLTWSSRMYCEALQMEYECETFISYIPPGGILSQVGIYSALHTAATLNFAQPDAMKVSLHHLAVMEEAAESVKFQLAPLGGILYTVKEVSPTHFFAVPSIYEKLMGSFQAAISEAQQSNLTDADIFCKIKDDHGFTRCRTCFIGGAAVPPKITQFFTSVGLPLFQSYGMTEGTTLLITTFPYGRPGSIGRVVNGCQVKIHQADKEGVGEFLFNGRNIFMGYLNNEEKTREIIDDDGWLHSGDAGRIDEDGFVYMTGRIKEMIIMTDSHKVVPGPIEERIKKEVPLLSNVMIIGDKMDYLTCLVTLKSEVDPLSGKPQDTLLCEAREMVASLGSTCTTVSEIVDQKDKAVYDAIKQGIERASLASTERPHKVKYFTVLPRDFSEAGGELGPTLKLRREVVMKKYAAEIKSMYNYDH